MTKYSIWKDQLIGEGQELQSTAAGKSHQSPMGADGMLGYTSSQISQFSCSYVLG